ncbi:hypothetical protein [Nisaea nitritireducens]|uniref:hypothetical protein n=1 Tax=Nisaea nitritireducens TaxID=568392 RepID=UPI0018681AE1|nr:hypothetical protein [Nisaea nitritireducens]
MAEDDLNSTMTEPEERQGDEFKLSDLKVGAPDKRGIVVTAILWAMHDFKIYMTEKGISPQFSDDPAQAQTQRENYLSLGPELADLNQQINLMKVGWARVLAWIAHQFGFPEDPRHNYYEQETAKGIAQALIDQPDKGRETLSDLSKRISKRLSNFMRVLYFTVCVVATVAITIGLAIYTERMPTPATETILGLNKFNVSVAAVMGCLGALLSTAIGLRSLSIDPAATLTINITYAIQRMLVGILGAVILHIALKSGLINNLVGTAQNTGAEGNAADKLAFLSVLAGFSERLVPNLLDRTAEPHSEDDDRKKPKTPAPKEPATAEPGGG